MGYAGVAQFFPGVVLGLYSKRVTTPGVFAGMATGVLIAVLLMFGKHDPIMGLNAGFVAVATGLLNREHHCERMNCMYCIHGYHLRQFSVNPSPSMRLYSIW